ncbi:MAG: ATP-dependent endonuclease [Candidatus Methanoperedens sp.]|nr:ATP-dependent endonuclease [Candidatus Methanoperedens sp.]
MRIKFVEIQNFRKLKSCRIDFSEKETVFVGANNSGKTSAMDALIIFLKEKKLSPTDFTISNWIGINEIGKSWTEEKKGDLPDISIKKWEQYLPFLDVWIQVEEKEVHYVSNLIPTLDWEGGLLGVRLRFEPKTVEELYNDFKNSYNAAKKTTEKAKESKGDKIKLKLWPHSMRDYLDKQLLSRFTIRAYILNPKECKEPNEGIATPQNIPIDNQSLNEDPFKGLIKIDLIKAQRGFSDSNTPENRGTQKFSGNLTAQFREYFSNHLNPSDLPDPEDVEALQAIEEAQSTFDNKLRESFRFPLSELEKLGYPGFNNPRITLSSKLEPIDSLNHASAVQFDVIKNEESGSPFPFRLPEKYNGLGYQNLISIVFNLIRFRDEWMRVGKIGKTNSKSDGIHTIEPLHLVLVEEPEAHLHAQVQQVFINKAFSVLRNHEYLKEGKQFSTQLVVSTHSSHIAHEIDFTSLRYFRRKPAEKCGEVPIATVVNLSKTFGKENDDAIRFAIRYLKTTHCDLFFADAAILVEGSAERMLVPHFIRNYFQGLTSSYISLLEIGGSHAHLLKPLIEDLGLISLIITDIDSVDPKKNNSSVHPARGKEYVTGNTTLKKWIPKLDNIDELIEVKDDKKISNSSITRVAYQIPKKIKIYDNEEEAISYTFEDSLVFENIQMFRDLTGNGLIKKFKNAIEQNKNAEGLGAAMFDVIKGNNVKKAEFALDLLFLEKSEKLNPPTYINEGLSWLTEKLKLEQKDFLEVDNKLK